MQCMLSLCLVLSLAAVTSAFVPSSFSPSLRCLDSALISCRHGTPGLQIRKSVRNTNSGLNLNMQIKGLYSDNNEKPKANKELLQIRFSSVDANKLSAWLKKWPFGAKKDGYGLPKTMLPLSAEPYGGGVKIIFKGTLDPWLQVDLEGDTIRVYRQSMMSTNFLQVSALKQREETKICDKLKEDLSNSDCGASGMIERALPVVEPKKEESAPAADAAAAPAGDAAPPSA